MLITVISKIQESYTSFIELLHISPEKFTFLKTFGSEFSYIDAWFTDQNSNPLEIEVKVITTLVIK